MIYEEKLRNVSVLGAAGKMGSGILLVTAMEMVNQKLKPGNEKREFVLNAIDMSDAALSGVMNYVREQAFKIAERQIVKLRNFYANREDLIDNEQIIRAYARDILSLMRLSTRIENAYDSNIIFEAVVENPELKIELISQIKKNNKNQPWFFTNTSSIPISQLDQASNLQGKILGVHFYNPPAIQKLVEVIKTETSQPELSYFVSEFIRNTGKIEVPSRDIAGFIGNGYFMRDLLYAIEEVKRLVKEGYEYHEAVMMINHVTQDFLIRPMGIFQLADYVGIDVIQFILKVMNKGIKKEDLHSDIIDLYIERGVRGGQQDGGKQKNGFLFYENGKIEGVYDTGKKRYINLVDFKRDCRKILGDTPGNWKPWKEIMKDKNKDDYLKTYFDDLKNCKKTLGCQLSLNYLKRFKAIGQQLVRDKVALRYDDVNKVIMSGFHHAYGPVNNYF